MTERRNVLLCVLHGVRADSLSCYGCERTTTPFLDEVARQGVRFPHVVASAAAALPALASLLTGKAAVRHGAHEEQPFLQGEHKLLSEYLQTAGYRTAAFSPHPWVSQESGLGRGFDALYTQRYSNRLTKRVLSCSRRATDHLLRRADAGARRTNQLLQRWLDSGAAPFFALLHYTETQIGSDIPPPFDRMGLPRGVGAKQARQIVRGIAADSTTAAAQGYEAVLRARYEGALRYLDQRLREVADLLRARGDWDRTLLVITADHGVCLGERGRVGHAEGLYEALLRVPLLIRCPGLVPEGFVVEEMAQSTDVVPTVLAALGIQRSEEPLQGRSLLSCGRATVGPDLTVSERFRDHGGLRSKAIRSKRDKLVWRSDEANEFYDLIADPGETQNLIEQEIERASLLRRQLFDWLAAMESAEGAVGSVVSSAELEPGNYKSPQYQETGMGSE